MAWADYVEALLRGGLPEVVDTGRQGSAQGDTRPEQTAPTGTVRDRESFAQVTSNLATTLSDYAPYLLVAGVLVVGLVLFRGRQR